MSHSIAPVPVVMTVALLLFVSASAAALPPSTAGALLPDPAWTLAGLTLDGPRILLVRRPITVPPPPTEEEFLPGDEVGPRGHPTRLRPGTDLELEEEVRRDRFRRVLLGAPAGLAASAVTYYLGLLATVGVIVARQPISGEEAGWTLVGGTLVSSALASVAGPAAFWAVGNAFGGRGSLLWTAVGGLAGGLVGGLSYGLVVATLDQGWLAAVVAVGLQAAGWAVGYELSSDAAALDASAEEGRAFAVRHAVTPSLARLPDDGLAASLALSF